MRWFKKFLKLARGDKWFVMETWGEILRVMIWLRSPLRPRLFTRMSVDLAEQTLPIEDFQPKLALIEQVSRHHIKRVTCLERVLATQIVLARRHIHLDVQFGVAQSESGFDAHAWLTYNGQSLEDVTDYSTMQANT